MLTDGALTDAYRFYSLAITITIYLRLVSMAKLFTQIPKSMHNYSFYTWYRCAPSIDAYVLIYNCVWVYSKRLYQFKCVIYLGESVMVKLELWSIFRSNFLKTAILCNTPIYVAAIILKQMKVYLFDPSSTGSDRT